MGGTLAARVRESCAVQTATQTLHRLTSYQPGRAWDVPVADPRVLQDLVTNDVDRLPWFFKSLIENLAAAGGDVSGSSGR
jgi:hypothetical protein